MRLRLEKAGFEQEALPCLDAVYRFALRLSAGDDAAAADLVQDTFLRAYRSWDTYTRGTRVLSWLFTICHNVALRQHERRMAHPEMTAAELDADDIESVAPTGNGPYRAWDAENAFFDTLVDDEVLRAVDALPAEFREAVVLKDLHDLSYEEIADILEVPRGTVKSRLHRGRRLLVDALYEYAVEVGFLPGAPQPAS